MAWEKANLPVFNHSTETGKFVFQANNQSKPPKILSSGGEDLKHDRIH
jgi:hypothetical protein